MSTESNTEARELRIPLEPNRGASFATSKLVQESGIWAYRSTGMLRAFSGVFLYLGYATLAGAFLVLGQGLLGAFAFFCAGGLFVGIGRYLRKRFSAGVSFDARARCIRIPGRDPFWPLLDEGQEGEVFGFEELAEIEILEKLIFTGNVTDRVRFELNLVLKDGRRFNVVSHADGALIASEAAELSRVVGVRVYDGRATRAL